MPRMNDEIKAFLEEGAKKFGIDYDALTLAIWTEKEEGYARQNITAELDRRGLAYTEDDLEVLVDKYFDLADSFTEERIKDTIEYADVELERTEKALANCLSVMKLEVSGDWAFGTLNFYGDAFEFQYNINTEELRIPGVTEEMQDMAPAIIGEIKFTIGESVKITDVEIDGKLITGTIEYEGTTAAFEYDTTTETWSTKDEFTPEMDAAANLIDKTVRNSVAKWRVHEMEHNSASKFEIAQGLHTYHVIHPDFGDKSLFEIDIPEDIREMSAEEVQSFIDGTLEDVTGYLEHQYGLELADTDINALKGELKDVCDERIAEGPLRGTLDALIAAAGEPTAGSNESQSRNNREDR